MKSFFLAFFLMNCFNITSQETIKDSLPFATIPEAPETFTPGTIVSRMIDGLGFRYYWATQGLVEKNLSYKPSEKGRTIEETIDHVYNLSLTILSSAEKKEHTSNTKGQELTIDEKRRATLSNFRIASELYKATDNIAEHTIIFVRPDRTIEFPFWNQINGPIEDAIWHAGQIVLLRRSAGNPINPKVNVFLGKLND